MKQLFLMVFAICAIFSAGLAQESSSDNDEFVLVQGKESDELISVNNLVGYWYNRNAQGTFNAINTPNKPRYVWLQQGQTMQINDDWVRDYSTGMKNTRWHVVGNRLYIYQPETGLQLVNVERQGKSKNYILTVNNIQYSRRVNLTGVASVRD